MADATFVQGDTAPPITAQIIRADGTPRDLADVTEVRFQMRRPGWTKYQVDAVAAVTDAATGWVSYDWAEDDLAVAADDFICQWQLTYSSGKVQTTTPPNTVEVRRQ